MNEYERMVAKYGQKVLDEYALSAYGSSTLPDLDYFGIAFEDELDMMIACGVESCEGCGWYEDKDNMSETDNGYLCWECERDNAYQEDF